MRKERVLGVLLIAVSLAVVLMASSCSPQELDATVVLFTLPLGIVLLVTKEEAVTRSREPPGSRRLPARIIHLHQMDGKELGHGKKTHR